MSDEKEFCSLRHSFASTVHCNHCTTTIRFNHSLPTTWPVLSCLTITSACRKWTLKVATSEFDFSPKESSQWSLHNFCKQTYCYIARPPAHAAPRVCFGRPTFWSTIVQKQHFGNLKVSLLRHATRQEIRATYRAGQLPTAKRLLSLRETTCEVYS